MVAGLIGFIVGIIFYPVMKALFVRLLKKAEKN